jgi:hypothetical protein
MKSGSATQANQNGRLQALKLKRADEERDKRGSQVLFIHSSAPWKQNTKDILLQERNFVKSSLHFFKYRVVL